MLQFCMTRLQVGPSRLRPGSGGHGQEGLWQEEHRLVTLFIGQELYAYVGWRVAPDLDDATSDGFLKAPGHQD
jgi:hypothetical protein